MTKLTKMEKMRLFRTARALLTRAEDILLSARKKHEKLAGEKKAA